MITKHYKFVNYLWDDAKASAIADPVDSFIYRSNLLGADLRLTNFAGGNTSCKIKDQDPLTGEMVDVMWVKGSGGDIGTLKRNGCAVLYMDRLQALKKRYRGLAYEDEMVGLFNYCLFDLNSKAPSIDTPLHAFLPFTHIDHLHPDAVIAIAASKDGEQITKEVFGGEVAWVPWQRPGFDLGLTMEKTVQENPGIKGIILGSHGLFSWGSSSYESYVNTLDIIEKASEYITEAGKGKVYFGGEAMPSFSPEERKRKALEIFPVIRGLVSLHQHMPGHFSDNATVLEFVNSNDLGKLAPMGTSCPDHFLRTKIRPMVLDTSDLSAESISRQVEEYRQLYAAYYNRCKHDDSPAMRDPSPVIILYPGVGMFSFAKDRTTARIASEFYINAINVMRGASTISAYQGLDEQEAFNIEYWLLEEAKLQRMPKPASLSGRVALVTGGTGGIGRAITELLLKHGACVAVADLQENQEYTDSLKKKFGKDVIFSVSVNVRDERSVGAAVSDAVMAFGGLDIIVHAAGLSISKPVEDTTEDDWDLLNDVMVKGQFLISKAAAAVMRKQGRGGDMVNIVSKNALFAGPNNAAYGTAKAGQMHLSRLLAAELGKDKIRVNVVNPDAVLRGSKIWEGAWAEGRAKAYGITVEELPKFYAARTILNEEILTEDIAKAVLVFVDGTLSKSTGNILNVDGGIAAVFPR
jgi:rhamnulose-1-phosphate aldolase/alcohol dehydrogenase